MLPAERPALAVLGRRFRLLPETAELLLIRLLVMLVLEGLATSELEPVAQPREPAERPVELEEPLTLLAETAVRRPVLPLRELVEP